MADDPWAAFRVTPAPVAAAAGDDPWAVFRPAPAPQAGPVPQAATDLSVPPVPVFDAMGNATGTDQPALAPNTMPYGEQMAHVGRVADDTVRMLADGATIGTADKLAAGLGTGFGLTGDYGKRLDEERARTGAIETANPDMARAGKAVGAMMAMPLLARAGLPVLGGETGGAFWRLGKAAIANGLLGGTAGMISHDGGLGDRIEPAAWDAATHAGAGAIGAAIPMGIGGIYQGARWLTDNASPALKTAADAIGISSRAAGMVNRALARDGLPQDATQAALDNLGPQGMIADLGPNTGQMLETIVQRPGAGQRVARDALDTRAAGTNARIASDLDEATFPAPVPSRVEAQFQAKRDALGPQYQLEESRSPWMSPHEANGLWTFADSLAAEQKGSGQALLQQAADALAPVQRHLNGSLARVPDVSPDGLMASRRVLDGLLAKVEESSQLQREGVGMRLQQIRQAIDDQVRSLNPAIKDVDAAYETWMRSSDALKHGQASLNPTVHPADIAERFNAAPMERQAAERLGARSAIDQAVGNNANDLSALRGIVKGQGDWPRQKLATYFGEEPTGRIINTLDRENTFNATRQGAQGNSRTAARASADADFSEAAGVRSTSDSDATILRSLLNMKFGDAGAKVLNRMNAGRIAGNMDSIGEEGARVLTAPAGDPRDQLLRAMFAKRMRDEETARTRADIEAGGGAQGSMVAAMLALRALRGGGGAPDARQR